MDATRGESRDRRQFSYECQREIRPRTAQTRDIVGMHILIQRKRTLGTSEFDRNTFVLAWSAPLSELSGRRPASGCGLADDMTSSSSSAACTSRPGSLSTTKIFFFFSASSAHDRGVSEPAESAG